MSDKNTEYQKKIREKRKDENKKTLQIPISPENHVKFKEYRQRYVLKSQELALEHLLNRVETLELQILEKKKPPTLKQWWIGLFSPLGQGNQ
jgi:hypothetical protein